MAKVLDLPKLSPTMEEGQIAKWHKREGDEVAVDDLLAEVETDKATMEYRSFDKGTLLKILAPEGAVVRLGEPVAVLGAKGEDVSGVAGGAAGGGEKEEKGEEKAAAPEAGEKGAPKKAAAPEAGEKEAPKKAPAGEADEKEAPKEAAADEASEKEDEASEKEPEASQKGLEASEKGNEASPAPGSNEKAQEQASVGPTGRVKASPYVRKLAREQGFDLQGVAGSGPGGRIIARDVAGAPKQAPAGAPSKEAEAPKAQPRDAKPKEAQPKEAEASKAQPKEARPAAPAVAAEGAEPEARPLSMMRKAIARRLTESKQTVPHFYLTIDIDADPLHALREQINADLATQGDNAPKVSFNDLIVKACAIALVRVPECNAQFTDSAILVHKRIDISVAVSVPEGLLTPVVRGADRKGVLAISAEVRELAGRARAKKLKPEEMQNGTFSISNLGMYGIDSFAAVINPPEGAILAVGQVRREPVVKGDAVVPGRKLAMTLSCDHRVIDGALGATFLRVLRQLLEHPTQILLG